MSAPVHIGGAAGFAGDRDDAAGPLIDHLAPLAGRRVLMFETLAERTLALAQLDRRADPARGMSPALDRLVLPVLGRALANGIAIVGNFGAANPVGAARRIAEVARAAGRRVRIAVVEGDDIRDRFTPAELAEREMEGERLAGAPPVVAANAYLGAAPIADALAAGADVVVTGRVADPALALGPLVAGHGWAMDDLDRIAAGTLAGHLLECGAQVTGGYFADPGIKDVPDLDRVGYPVAEVAADGTILLGKPAGTGGRVDRMTVIEQLLYEMHDPAAYLTPDVTLDVTGVAIEEIGPDRVRITGARGRTRPDRLKATVCVDGGFLGEGEISYAGPNAGARARLAIEVVRRRMGRIAPGLTVRADAIGIVSVFGDTAGRELEGLGEDARDVRVRLACASPDRGIAERLAAEVEALYCAGPAGGAGVRTRVTPRLVSTSCLVERERVIPRVSFIEERA